MLVEPRSTRGQRVTLEVMSISGVAPDNGCRAARRIRLMTVSEKLTPGDVIRVKATLARSAGPALPGGYDFARYGLVLGFGATGYSLGAPAIEQGAEASLSGRFSESLQRLRQAIGERITAAIPGEAGAIATSLITGERGGISEETTDAFRDPGLLHILSISGLHMVIMAGAVFVAVRMMLAAVPAIALRYPIKKWAAAAALLAAGAYLLLSGSSIATVRAFIMIAIMFLAVMLDRPALAMRNVALSAMVILVVAPESLLDAGFQMSFAAVVSLISAYELVRDRQAEGAERGTLLRLAFFLGGIVLSTVIASLAVAPFAAYHFHRSQQYALLANLVAIPICNLIVMPAGLLTLVLMPFGLEALPLWVMEQGIAAVVWTAEFVAALPGAVAHIPAIGDTAFALMVAGGLWLTLWRMRWRALGLGAVAVGVAFATQTPRPDVLAGLDGALVAVRGADGRLAASSPGRSAYELKRWLEHDGDSREAKDVLKERLFRCDGVGCTVKMDARDDAFGSASRGGASAMIAPPRPSSLLRSQRRRFVRSRRSCSIIQASGATAATPSISRRARRRRTRRASPPAMRVETIAARRGATGRGRRRCARGNRHDLSQILLLAGARSTAGEADAEALGFDDRSIAADETNEAALDVHLVGAENAGLELGVRSLERDGRALLAKALQGRLLLLDQGDDDVAVLGGVAAADDDRVAVVNAGLDHGVALHLQSEMLAVGQDVRRAGDVVGMVLDGRDGHTGGDAAHDRNGYGAAVDHV